MIRAVSLLREVSHEPSLTIIYGQSGSGKTRLLRHMAEAFPIQSDRQILHWCTTELVAHLLDSLKYTSRKHFVSSLLRYTVFLIDNIWILGGKPRTAMEIFSLFQRLIDHNRSVVIASDLAPSVIASWGRGVAEVVRHSRVLKIERPPCVQSYTFSFEKQSY